jgi:hypothetical protein
LTYDEVRQTAIEVRLGSPAAKTDPGLKMFIGATNSTPDMVCYVLLFLAEDLEYQEVRGRALRSALLISL